MNGHFWTVETEHWELRGYVYQHPCGDLFVRDACIEMTYLSLPVSGAVDPNSSLAKLLIASFETYLAEMRAIDGDYYESWRGEK